MISIFPVAAGGDPRIERDDDGIVIDDHRDVLIYRTTTAEDAVGTFHKATVLSLFHHWERSARDRTGQPHGKFTTLSGLVEAEGYAIDPALADIHLLANTLKHANDKHGAELYARRRDYFRRDLDPTAGNIEWFEEIDLSATDIRDILSVLRSSGPTG